MRRLLLLMWASIGCATGDVDGAGDARALDAGAKHDAADPNVDGRRMPDAGVPPSPANLGWIGGACASPTACEVPGTGSMDHPATPLHRSPEDDTPNTWSAA